MGSIQILTKCCNSDELEIDEDDENDKPKVLQKPVITRDKKDKMINSDLVSTDSFNTAIPCFSK